VQSQSVPYASGQTRQKNKVRARNMGHCGVPSNPSCWKRQPKSNPNRWTIHCVLREKTRPFVDTAWVMNSLLLNRALDANIKSHQLCLQICKQTDRPAWLHQIPCAKSCHPVVPKPSTLGDWETNLVKSSCKWSKYSKTKGISTMNAARRMMMIRILVVSSRWHALLVTNILWNWQTVVRPCTRLARHGQQGNLPGIRMIHWIGNLTVNVLVDEAVWRHIVNSKRCGKQRKVAIIHSSRSNRPWLEQCLEEDPIRYLQQERGKFSAVNSNCCYCWCCCCTAAAIRIRPEEDK